MTENTTTATVTREALKNGKFRFRVNGEVTLKASVRGYDWASLYKDTDGKVHAWFHARQDLAMKGNADANKVPGLTQLGIAEITEYVPAETTKAAKKETAVTKTDAKPETKKTPAKRVEYTPQGRINAKKEYTVQEAADLMGMSANAMNHWFRRDYFPTEWITRDGSARKVRVVKGADLSTYVKTRAAEVKAKATTKA
ncbi:hypothetical protein ACIA03_06085 [Nocardioides sp. NPDC051685]|uniref:hypothetical protein n=1 Tax=Nocardioides sp. NPDC051685 TaxID=3364334 RepID=UPI00378A5DCD